MWKIVSDFIEVFANNAMQSYLGPLAIIGGLVLAVLLRWLNSEQTDSNDYISQMRKKEQDELSAKSNAED